MATATLTPYRTYADAEGAAAMTYDPTDEYAINCICKGKYMILCPEHKLEIDTDGTPWCKTCDTGHQAPQPVTCPCQHMA